MSQLSQESASFRELVNSLTARSGHPLAYGLPRGLGTADPRLAGLAEVAGLDAASLKRAKRHRVAALRIYGNAIAPPVAAQFVRDFDEAVMELLQ